MNVVSTYSAQARDKNADINFEAYAINLSKFTLRLKFAGFILSDGYGNYDVKGGSEHAELVKNGGQTKIYFAHNHSIQQILKKIQVQRLANYSTEQCQGLNQDQFKLIAVFHEEDSTEQNYSFTTNIDLTTAEFWQEIKHSASSKQRRQQKLR